MENGLNDLISRQAAIDAFHVWFGDGFEEDRWWNSTHVLAAIEGLPSVRQEHKWETCFECPLSHGCPKIKGCTNEQAIEYASQIPNDCPLSAQPEQRWIPWDSGKFPEESGTYTITAYDGATKRVTYAKYQKRLKRWELTGARAYWRVLAWMPPTKPYREE